MKKISKKVFFIVVLAIISTFTATALQADINVIEKPTFGEVEYSYEGGISAEKAEQIVKAMLKIYDDDVQPLNILCIFGHSKEEGIIKTTEHNYYTTAPKCRVTYSEVEYCTRGNCSYYAVLDEFSIRTSCH